MAITYTPGLASTAFTVSIGNLRVFAAFASNKGTPDQVWSKFRDKVKAYSDFRYAVRAPGAASLHQLPVEAVLPPSLPRFESGPFLLSALMVDPAILPDGVLEYIIRARNSFAFGLFAEERQRDEELRSTLLECTRFTEEKAYEWVIHQCQLDEEPRSTRAMARFAHNAVYSGATYVRWAKVRIRLKAQGPTGPLMTFLAGGGDPSFPNPPPNQERWQLIHIYNGQFPFEGRASTLDARNGGEHYADSAGLALVHPAMADCYRHSSAVMKALRARAWVKFGYDPDGYFSS